jgi:hypothetical protein
MYIERERDILKDRKEKVIYDHISRMFLKSNTFDKEKSIMTYTHRFTCMYIGQVTFSLKASKQDTKQQSSPAMIMAVNPKPYTNSQQLQLVTRRL